jgi:hypothetical protein
LPRRQRDEILAKFRDVKVVDPRPRWMTDQLYSRIESNELHDIDVVPSGWLAVQLKK